MNRDNHGSVATYVIVALILGMLTYIEFAIIEYDFAWLSRTAVMVALIVMTIVKFALVVMFFMHLKDDDRVFTGFFSSGMILALGTFIGLAFLFTVTSVSNYTFTNISADVVEQEASAGAPGPVDQSQPVTAPEAGDQDAFAVGEEGTVTQTVAAFDAAAAEAAYMASCSSCHQPGGTGLPGVFPPMANNANDIYNAEGGREYLMHAVLFGLQGPIEVDGTTYNGAMPAWAQLSDADLAGTLNHITTAWGNDAGLIDFEPYTADELAATRGAGLSPADVHAERLALDIQPSAAAAADVAPADEAPAEEAEPAEEDAEEGAEAEEAEEAGAADEAPAAVAGDFDLAAGEVVYQSHCFACHQGTGEGLASVFPPLAGNAAELYNADGGREYLLQAVLFGVQGPIEVDGVTYNGAMPSWTQLDDQAIADVLNFISAGWDNAELLEDFEPYTADEVAAERPEPLSPTDVHDNRPDVSAAPAEDAEAAEEAEETAVAEEAEAEEAEEAAAAEAETVATADFDREAAEAAYLASCSSCHAATGAGIPQVFPPLAGHVDDLYNADGGREYVMNVILYGLTGSITVDGVTYGGAMPAWANLSDEALADVYNHIVTAWGNEDSLEGFEPMTAEEFAAQRGLGLSTADVYEQRGQLGLD